MKFLRQSIVWVLCRTLMVSTTGAAALPQDASAQGEEAQDANLTPQELDNLVSPIALYPDGLVARILAAATYPDQLTAANDWVKANPNMNDQALMEAVDRQEWDPSVKALTQFPSVLGNLTKNLSWTSALGEASFYQQKDVMAAIQRLRKQAKTAGNLKSSEQIKVVQQDPQTIIIQPANPQVVYVPQYNPTIIYGAPYNPSGYSGADLALTGIISFGIGMAVGAAIGSGGCCGWGWCRGGWGCGWRGGTVVFQRNVYVSRSRIYAHGYRPGRPVLYRGSNRQTNIGTININKDGNTTTNRPNISTRPAAKPSSREAWRNNRARDNSRVARPSSSPSRTDRGFGQRPTPSTRSGAFGGYNRGGSARAESMRGRSSARGSSMRGGSQSKEQTKSEDVACDSPVGMRLAVGDADTPAPAGRKSATTPPHSGYPRMPQEQINQWLRTADEKGFPLLVHCNGDAGIDMLINAVKKVRGGWPRPDLRTKIIHAQTIGEDPLDSAASNGLVSSFFPIHVVFWGDRHRDLFLGPARAARIDPSRSALDRGMKITLHHDAPIASWAMLPVVSAAVNRVTSSGKLLGPEERISAYEAFRAVTKDAAWQYFEENRKGTLEAGKLADLVVLSDDPLKVDPAKINEIKVLQTVKEGKVVFRASQ